MRSPKAGGAGDPQEAVDIDWSTKGVNIFRQNENPEKWRLGWNVGSDRRSQAVSERTTSDSSNEKRQRRLGPSPSLWQCILRCLWLRLRGIKQVWILAPFRTSQSASCTRQRRVSWRTCTLHAHAWHVITSGKNARKFDLIDLTSTCTAIDSGMILPWHDSWNGYWK